MAASRRIEPPVKAKGSSPSALDVSLCPICTNAGNGAAFYAKSLFAGPGRLDPSPGRHTPPVFAGQSAQPSRKCSVKRCGIYLARAPPPPWSRARATRPGSCIYSCIGPACACAIASGPGGPALPCPLTVHRHQCRPLCTHTSPRRLAAPPPCATCSRTFWPSWRTKTPS